jgi:hypothetical protein
MAFSHTKKVDKESFIKAGSGSRRPDLVLDVRIRPKRSGSGSATLLIGQLISVAEPHHFYASSAPGKNLCCSGSNPTVSVADPVGYGRLGPDPDPDPGLNNYLNFFGMCKSHKYFRNLCLTF